jgi:hypothetical protein
MSLKFLAVGQTFAGLRGDKSPFAVRKDNQLPVFQSSPRFTAKHPGSEETVMVQADFLQKREEESAPLPFAESIPAEPITTPQQPMKRKAKFSWGSVFKFRWFRAQPARTDLVQSELSLEKIRVMRNDLTDSDLRLILKRKKKKPKNVFASTQENNSIARQGWSELTARLFELGQK